MKLWTWNLILAYIRVLYVNKQPKNVTSRVPTWTMTSTTGKKNTYNPTPSQLFLANLNGCCTNTSLTPRKQAYVNWIADLNPERSLSYLSVASHHQPPSKAGTEDKQCSESAGLCSPAICLTIQNPQTSQILLKGAGGIQSYKKTMSTQNPTKKH